MQGCAPGVPQAWSRLNLGPVNRFPIRLRGNVLLGLVRLLLHLISAGWLSYGYMTDELYYLDCTNHMAWLSPQGRGSDLCTY